MTQNITFWEKTRLTLSAAMTYGSAIALTEELARDQQLPFPNE